MPSNSTADQEDHSSEYSSFYLGKRLFKDYVRPHKKKLLLAVLLMAIVATGDAFLIWLIKPSLDGIFIEHETFLLYLIPALIIGIAIVKGFADYGQSYLIKSIGQEVVSKLQLNLYSHLIKSDLALLNQQSAGQILSKFTHDIFNIRLATTALIVDFAKNMLTVVLLIGVMFYNDYRLAAVTFIVFPVLILPILKYGKKMKRITHDTQHKLAEYTKYLNERLHNVKIIKAFCAENHEIKKGSGYLDGILVCYKKAIRIDSIVSPIMEMFSAIGIASIIAYGGYSISRGMSTPGNLFSFIGAFMMAYKPIKGLASMNMTLQAGLASARRILAVLDKKNLVEDNGLNANLKVSSGQIEFKNVSFTYDAKTHDVRHPVIRNLSLKIAPNQVVAVVGESGSGKSTIMELLLKFYEPTQGAILIDGQNLAKYSTASIRHNISLVPQDPMLFDASIKDNIVYGDERLADQARIETAVTVAHAAEFIKNLPQKYDTMIGKFGIKLSGGQKQRIAIARAVLRQAPILILDEATSSLDQVSEQHVKNAILSLRSQYKVIITITHRLSTIQSSDIIYVMKKGQIAESGTHKALLDKKGEYSRLYYKKILV